MSQPLQQVGSLANNVGNLASLFLNITTGGYGIVGDLGEWADTLQPASWRGCGFAVFESITNGGRRTALHEYPYRDDVWIEDLGRAPRAFSFRAFIVGDDVYDQRDAMRAALEQPGPGVLTHPSLGNLTCSLTPPFAMREVWDSGRVVELEFTFIETAQPLYPSTVSSTQSAVGTSADGALSAISSDFNNTIVPALANGAEVVEKGVATTERWAGLAEQLAGSASLLVHSVAGLQGNFGRYNMGALGILQPATATVGTLLDGVIAARTAVSVASEVATALAGVL